MNKKDLINELNDKERLLNKKYDLEKEMFTLNEKIIGLQKELKENKQKSLNIKSLKNQKIEKADNYMSEEEYLKKGLNRALKPKKTTKFKKKDNNMSLVVKGIFAIILFLIIMIIKESGKINTMTLISLIILFGFDILPIIFCHFKKWIALIISLLFDIYMATHINDGILIFGLVILSILLVIFSEIILNQIKKIREHINEKNNEIDKNNKISELKKKYQEDRERYYKNSETRKEEIRYKYDEQEKEISKVIESISEKLKNEQEKKTKLEKNIDKVTSDINKGSFLSLHKNYQDINIISKFKVYLEKGRCDNLKECINLYEQEKKYEDLNNKILELEKNAQENLSSMHYQVNQVILTQDEQIKNLNEQLAKTDEKVEYMKKEKEAGRQIQMERAENISKKSANELKKNYEEYDKEVKEKIERL